MPPRDDARRSKQPVVVDSSVAAKWVFPEPLSGEALRLVVSWDEARRIVVVPPHFWVEVANAARHKARPRAEAPAVTRREAVAALGVLRDLGLVTSHGAASLAAPALELALDLGLTTWDAAYLALAESVGAEFWTADRDLARRARRRFPWVRLLAEADTDH